MLFYNLRVVELASVLAAPSVGMFFAELGAEIIKIENLTTKGDVTRTWKLPSESKSKSVSAYFSSVNWGKKSIALDLRQPQAQKIAKELIKNADMVLSSYIPGTAAKFGLDAESLLKLNPRLICGEINGYGETTERAAFDAIIQAETGFTYLNGEGNRIYKMPVALMDVLAAHQLKEAMLLAYIERLQTGKGKRVTVSLMEAGIASLTNQAANVLVANTIPQAIGSEHPNIVPYGTIFYAQDQLPLVLAIGTDAQFAQLCEVLGLVPPADFATNPQRVANRQLVNTFLATAIQKLPRAELLLRCAERQIPAGAVNNPAEALQMPLVHRNLLHSEELIGLRSFIGQGIEKNLLLSPPPIYNQHATEILTSLGYTDTEIQKWKQDRILET